MTHAMSLFAPRQNTAAELAAFETTCTRLEGFDAGLNFESVDGFLTAVAAGPRAIESGQWLPALGGDTYERVFADPEDQAQALRSLQARLKLLRDLLDPEILLDDPDLLRLEPLIIETGDDERAVAEGETSAEAVAAGAALQTGAFWAQGFLAGVDALPGLWAEPADDKAVALFGQAFDHIAALLLPVGGEEFAAHLKTYYPDVAPPTRDELIVEACMAVQDLRLYWIDFAPRPATRRVEPKPGRNDPCPCGSGKKYKRCHGQG